MSFAAHASSSSGGSSARGPLTRSRKRRLDLNDHGSTSTGVHDTASLYNMIPVGSSGQVRSLVHGGTSSTSSNSSLSNNPSVTITLQVSPSGSSSGPMDHQGPSAAKVMAQAGQHSPPMGGHPAPSPPTSYVKQNCDQPATIGYSANASLVIRPSSIGPSVPGAHPHQQLTAAAVSPSGGA